MSDAFPHTNVSTTREAISELLARNVRILRARLDDAIDGRDGKESHILLIERGHDYAPSGNRLFQSTTEGANTITSQVDWSGRLKTYIDTWAKATMYAYDAVSRLTDSTSPAGVKHTSYDAAGRVGQVLWDGAVVATPSYDGAGELASVAYGNGTSLSSIRA